MVFGSRGENSRAHIKHDEATHKAKNKRHSKGINSMRSGNIKTSNSHRHEMLNITVVASYYRLLISTVYSVQPPASGAEGNTFGEVCGNKRGFPFNCFPFR